MKIFTETRPLPQAVKDFLPFFSETDFFFDIETTGFSARYGTVYLIGCARRQGGQVAVTQFFAETPEAEPEILAAFSGYLKDFAGVVTFNGLGFDVPFLKERCQTLGIPLSFSGLKHTDLFRQLTPYKKLLHLPDLKQKSIEQFLGLEREDIYSGGDLIPVYRDYVKDRDPEKLSLLTLHNLEDVLGMTELLPVLAYPALFAGGFTVTGTELAEYREYDGSKGQELYLRLALAHPLPKQISSGRGELYLAARNDTASLKLRIFQGELKYFYPNYRDYYYLPREDMAIHKSVASYVDKEFRTPAKAATCYSKKSGRFLPQYGEAFSPCLKADYGDKQAYFELTEEFLSSGEWLKKYAAAVLGELLK